MATDVMRNVGWSEIDGALAHENLVVSPHRSGELGELLLAMYRLPQSGSVQELVFAALQLMRERLGVERAALFLRSASGRWLQGTVGTALDGSFTDERGMRYPWANSDDAAHEDLIKGARAWLSREDAPLISHEGDKTRVAKRGWLVKTPVRAGGRAIGMFHNDAALTGAPFAAELQDRVAFVLQFLAPMIELAMRRTTGEGTAGLSAPIRKARELLAADPTLSHEALAGALGLSAPSLSRRFSKEMRVSLIDYRNRVRLERFFKLVDEQEAKGHDPGLLQTALDSGFGSYAQFHRVFTAAFGRSPRKYLTPDAP